MEQITIEPIGFIQSPYKQKFAIPRQPRLVPEAKAKLRFVGEFNREEFVRGIEAFTHIWLLFRFHETADKGYSALVRPPRSVAMNVKACLRLERLFDPMGLA